MLGKSRRELWAVGLASFLAIGFVSQLRATELTFQFTGAGNGTPIPQTYGDRVIAGTMGTFTYGTGGGFTPNVVVDYRGKSTQVDLNHWTTGYNQLVNVLEYEPDGANGYQIILTADPGFEVSLESFDLGNFGGAVTVPGVRVLDRNGSEIFSRTNFAIPAATGPHTDFDFAPFFTDTKLTIDIDTTGMGGNSDNIGLDNIRFSQSEVVPEPGVCLLLIGLGAGLLRRRNQLTQHGHRGTAAHATLS
jgi:hypothetical protein